MESSYLGLLGLAKRASFVEAGDEACRAAINAGKARLILTASDASERTYETFAFLAENANVPHIQVNESREELGNALGRRPCATVAVCDIGLTAAIVKKLAAINEDAARKLPEIEARAKKIAARKNKGKKK